MRCPFGCRQAHSKETARERCAEYYKSREGKIKKKELNRKRSLQGSFVSSLHETDADNDRGLPINETTFDYLQTVTSLIERRRVSEREILRMVMKILRQLSIDKDDKWLYPRHDSRGKPPPG